VVRKIIVAADIRARGTSEGAQPVLGMSPEAFNALIRNEIAMWRAILKERKIQGGT
jgi:tripartite-type tricarboxylate transporter receptor subunit TctC